LCCFSQLLKTQYTNRVSTAQQDGYTRGGLGKNGQSITAPIMLEMKSLRTCLGYDDVAASIPTPTLSTTREVLFVAGGLQTDLSEEKSTVNCVELILPKFEIVVVANTGLFYS